MIKLFEIVILWVYYTIPFGFSLFWHVWDISFQLLKLLLWLRTTDEGSVPEMRIWSILLFESDLKWCIHLSRSLFLYILSSRNTICRYFRQRTAIPQCRIQRFRHRMGIRTLKSSPCHNQSNGKADSAVKIAKTMHKKAKRSGRNIWKSLLD